MVNLLGSIETRCPYCDSIVVFELEPGMEGQAFIEDCPVCCRPIELVQGEGPVLDARRDDE